MMVIVKFAESHVVCTNITSPGLLSNPGLHIFKSFKALRLT